MKDELKKELDQRGTAEISNGVVNQITQAIHEDNTKVEFLMFGEMKKQRIRTIAEACAQCNHCRFDTVEKCQERQGRDARARGFSIVICPEQFVNNHE